MTKINPAKLNSQRRRELEAEREFLVQSLRDLESERAEGGIDDETFATLHSDYTARTAEVLRALVGGDDRRPKPPPVPKERRILLYLAIAVFSIGLAVSLAKFAGTRQPGGGLTGNSVGSLNPNSFEGKLEAARQFVVAREYPRAFVAYTEAQRLEPNRADVRVEFAQVLIQQLRTEDLDERTAGITVEAADSALDAALKIDPKYASAYAFKGALLTQFRARPDLAKPFLEKYLRLAPNGSYEPMARSLLAGAHSTTSKSAPTTSTSTSTSTLTPTSAQP